MATIPFPFGPCRICNAKSTGIHYGVATCEGCKGFFKRSIGKSDKYKCYFGGECAISPDNRNRCKSCRYKMCLQMGMAIEAVKMGRIPKVDRERAIQALQQQNHLDPQTSMWNDKSPHQQKLAEQTSDYESNDSGSDNGDSASLRMNNTKNQPLTVSNGIFHNSEHSHLRGLLDPPLKNDNQNDHMHNMLEVPPNTLEQENMYLDPKYASVAPSHYSQQTNNSLIAASNLTNRTPCGIKRKGDDLVIDFPPLDEFRRFITCQSKTFRSISNNLRPENSNVNNSFYNSTALRTFGQQQPTYAIRVPQEEMLPNNSMNEQYPYYLQLPDNPSLHQEQMSSNETYNYINNIRMNEDHIIPPTIASETLKDNSQMYNDDIMAQVSQSNYRLGESMNHREFNNENLSSQPVESYIQQNEDRHSPLAGTRPVIKQEKMDNFEQMVMPTMRNTSPDLPQAYEQSLLPHTLSIPAGNYSKLNSEIDSDAIQVIKDPYESILSLLKNMNQQTKNVQLSNTISRIKAAHNATSEFIMRNIRVMEGLQKNGCQNSEHETESTMWDRLKSIISTVVARIIEFSSYTPGFNELKNDDRTILLNDVIFDMWMIDASRFLTNGESYLIFEDGTQYSKKWMSHFLPSEMVIKLFEFAQDLNQKNLTFTELALLKAICLCNPDRALLEDKVSIRTLRNHFLDAFNCEVIRNHTHDSGSILLDVGLFFPRLKELHDLQVRNIETLDLNSPTQGTV